MKTDQKKEDRRVAKTRGRIQQALTRLLMEKDLREITVRELTDLADINRGTFYLHYQDVYDLFGQLEKSVLDDFKVMLAPVRRQSAVPLLPMLRDLIQFIADNADVLLSILRTRETTFLQQIIELGRPQSVQEWRLLFPDNSPAQYDYCFTFLAYGCVAMLRRWVDGGMPESPEEMALLTEKVVSSWRKGR